MKTLTRALLLGHVALAPEPVTPSVRIFHFDTLFLRADIDHSGKVSIPEASQWLEQGPRDNKVGEDALLSLDTNNDKELDRTEWFTLMHSLLGSFPTMQVPASTFRIQLCSSSQLGPSFRKKLTSKGLTKCVIVYAVVLAGEDTYPDSYLLFAANVVAEFLDPNSDGSVDQAIIQQFESCGTKCPFLAGFRNKSYAERHCTGNCLDLMSYNAVDGARDARRLLVEEVHHMLFQYGWATAYPDSFGISSWDSIVAKQKRKLQCSFYHHPENLPPTSKEECERACADTCDRVCHGRRCYQCTWRLRVSNDSSLESRIRNFHQTCSSNCPKGICKRGGCTDPDCDVVEFYFRLHMAYVRDSETLYFEMMDHQLRILPDMLETLVPAMRDLLLHPRTRQRPVTGVYLSSEVEEASLPEGAKHEL